MRLAIYEILERASKLKKKEEKVEFLRQNGVAPLQTVLKYALDPNVKWLLPEGPAPYKPSEIAVENEGMLYSQARTLYLYVEGGNPALTPSRRQMLFVNLLESIHPKDAELLVAIKDKKLPYKGITKEIVLEAFPGLF